LVFNIDSPVPASRTSIIYDTDYDKNTITIAQPTVPVSPSTKFDQLHLTTVVHSKQRKTRIGLQCRPVKFIAQYPLNNKATTKALILEYTKPAKEINIRTGFRLPLSQRHAVKAKLLYNQRGFFTAKDFKIKDISFSGLGVVVSKGKKEAINPLLELTSGTLLPMGICLVDNQKEKPIAAFPLKIRVARINPNYSETHTLLGLQIVAIAQKDEDILIQFIHDAQICELKRLSQKG